MINKDSLLQGAFPEKYKWSVDYEVAVPLIDAQHKKLFLIFRNLVHACQKKKEQTVALQSLEFMADYVDFHFKAEEKFWALDTKIFATHRRAHYNFVRQVYKATGNVQKREDITDDILLFLGEWLVKHVIGMDRTHFRQLRDKGMVDPDGFLQK